MSVLTRERDKRVACEQVRFVCKDLVAMTGFFRRLILYEIFYNHFDCMISIVKEYSQLCVVGFQNRSFNVASKKLTLH